MDKKWYLSATLWTNFGLALVAAAMIPIEAAPIDPKTMVIVQSFVNVLLRFKTNSGITA